MHIDLSQRRQSWVLDKQLDSRLFGKLPPEIRNQIFLLALIPLEMLANRYHRLERVDDSTTPHDFRVRQDHDGNPDDDILEELETRKPGPQKDLFNSPAEDGRVRYPDNTGPGTYRWHLSPALLATCRRVYVEAHLLI